MAIAFQSFLEKENYFQLWTVKRNWFEFFSLTHRICSCEHILRSGVFCILVLLTFEQCYCQQLSLFESIIVHPTFVYTFFNDWFLIISTESSRSCISTKCSAQVKRSNGIVKPHIKPSHELILVLYLSFNISVSSKKRISILQASLLSVHRHYTKFRRACTPINIRPNRPNELSSSNSCKDTWRSQLTKLHKDKSKPLHLKGQKCLCFYAGKRNPTFH